MPPRKYKVNHHRDKGSSYAGFLERNAEVLPEHMMKKRNQARAEKQSESESEESDAQHNAKARTSAPKVEEPTRERSASEDSTDEALAKEFGRSGGVAGESRREREARQAEEARKRYQELHLAGKTAEAKSDMARLAEIRRKREEAALKAQREKEEKDAAKSRGRRVNPNADVVREAFM